MPSLLAMTLDLWPLIFDPENLQQCPLTWWIFVASFIKIPRLSKDRDIMSCKIGVNGCNDNRRPDWWPEYIMLPQSTGYCWPRHNNPAFCLIDKSSTLMMGWHGSGQIPQMYLYRILWGLVAWDSIGQTLSLWSPSGSVKALNNPRKQVICISTSTMNLLWPPDDGQTLFCLCPFIFFNR